MSILLTLRNKPYLCGGRLKIRSLPRTKALQVSREEVKAAVKQGNIEQSTFQKHCSGHQLGVERPVTVLARPNTLWLPGNVLGMGGY